MKMQLAEVARALNIEAKEEWEDISITSVCFDSRKIESGALFIPLVAENDGHKYVEAAINGGAVATLWQEDHSENIPDIWLSAIFQTGGRSVRRWKMQIRRNLNLNRKYIRLCPCCHPGWGR